uniref:Large ribosomal subunit protein uL18 n=1 Tax=candidate division WOR-3 bacterium TaxID=2052148 RepID=A0A7C3N8V3_UNCW3
MEKNIEKRIKKERRHRRIKGKIQNFSKRPRLVVFRSLKHIYAQIIDDSKGVTLCSASTLDKDFPKVNGDKKAKAFKVGEIIAKRALEKGLKQIVFDRNGYRYHGRVKSLADGARKSGLDF